MKLNLLRSPIQAALLATALLASATATADDSAEPTGDGPSRITWWNGVLAATLSADWIEPEHDGNVAQVAILPSFTCENATDGSNIYYTAGFGETVEGQRRELSCAYGDMKVTLYVRPVGAYTLEGDAYLNYRFSIDFRPSESEVYAGCVQDVVESGVNGPASLAPVSDIFQTSLSGVCGDYRISADIILNEGWHDPDQPLTPP